MYGAERVPESRVYGKFQLNDDCLLFICAPQYSVGRERWISAPSSRIQLWRSTYLSNTQSDGQSSTWRGPSNEQPSLSPVIWIMTPTAVAALRYCTCLVRTKLAFAPQVSKYICLLTMASLIDRYVHTYIHSPAWTASRSKRGGITIILS